MVRETKTMKNRSLVIGMGEVGKALVRVLIETGYDVKTLDIGESLEERFDVIHICFPYSDNFIQFVESYKEKHLDPGGLVIIHSTVPLGTTEKVLNAVHSPIRGVHPNLDKGIKTFRKYFGGSRAQDAADYFAPVTTNVLVTPFPRETEALKLLDTSYYGWNILFEKAVYAYCKENELDFDIVYQDANESYNDGYKLLGMGNVVRPVLRHVDGKIGGHCVVPNAKLLNHPIGDFIIRENDQL